MVLRCVFIMKLFGGCFRHCDPATLSRCHLVTLSPFRLATLSPCHPVTLSQAHVLPHIVSVFALCVQGWDTAGKGVLRFHKYWFSLGSTVVPTALSVTPLLPLIQPGMLGSSVMREILWLFFVPVTVFDVTFLPVIRAGDANAPSPVTSTAVLSSPRRHKELPEDTSAVAAAAVRSVHLQGGSSAACSVHMRSCSCDLCCACLLVQAQRMVAECLGVPALTYTKKDALHLRKALLQSPDLRVHGVNGTLTDDMLYSIKLE